MKNDNTLDKEISTDEPLIVRSLGYLVVPKAVKVLLGGGSPIHYPNPRASLKVDSEEVHLKFTFPRDKSVKDCVRLKALEE